MEKPYSRGTRKQLQNKMLKLFTEEMDFLPHDLQRILADDLVTAFHNRLMVFMKIQSRPQLQVEFNEENLARIRK